MEKVKHITILGGGPAGLAVGYYAKKAGIAFTIYEASDRIGGNAITIQHEPFRFDSGAHRFHDKDEEITREMLGLIGDDLKKIHVPSAIFYRGKYIDFPLSPLNLLSKLGPLTFIMAAMQLLISRIKRNDSKENFEGFAVSTYGRTIAELFLLNYSRKLWGVSCDRLSPCISGKRLKELNLMTFIKEAFGDKKAKAEHLDGSFYYPKDGFGTIADRLAEFCGQENIQRNSRLTRFFHDSTAIRDIEINGERTVTVDTIISTLPLPYFIQSLDPPPPEEILSMTKDLRFRSMIIVTVFINKDSVTKNGSIYFPDRQFPFTRVYEPRNRSQYMSPSGKTSLCAEIPCFHGSDEWNMDEKELVEHICSYFIRFGWMRAEEIIDTYVQKLHFAYPLLDKDFNDNIRKIFSYLTEFGNLRTTGRNGKFLYAHVHDMLRFGKDIIDEFQR